MGEEDRNDVPDPEGTEVGCLVAMLIAAVLLSAIPLGGVVVAFLGWVWAKGSTNDRAETLSYRGRKPMGFDEVAIGEEATFSGRVTTPAEVTTPLGQPAVLAELWMDDELSDDAENPVATWRQQMGPDSITLRGQGGCVVVAGRWSLLSEKVRTTNQLDGKPPPHAPLSEDERARLQAGCEQYGERWLEAGAEALVTGVVTAVDEVMSEGDAGYRGQGRMRQITLGPASDGAIRISTFTPARVAARARQAKAVIIGGWIAVLLGLTSAVAWIAYLGA